jgi:hypothetical protein
MRDHDYTDMGGTGRAFLTTHWSVIEATGSGDEDRDRDLIGLPLSRYWRTVYCYLQRRGYPNEQAKDLTQGFFHEVVLQRHLVEKADPAKGRFRSFLLIALNRYLSDARDAQTARKRIPKERLVSLDIIELAELLCQVSGLTQRAAAEVVGLRSGAAVSVPIRGLGASVARDRKLSKPFVKMEFRLPEGLNA